MLDCKILTSQGEFEALADEWRELHERTGTSLFTDYNWFEVWWRTMGNNGGRTLHIVTGRRDQKLAALLPLVVIRKKGFRVLQTIGAEAFYYGDMLCDDPADANELWRVARESPHYDFAHMRDVSPGSHCERILSTFAHLHDKNKEIYLQLEWKTAEAWKATLSKQFRRNISKPLRLLEEKGTVHYELCQASPVPRAIIDGMVEHKMAWCNKFDKRGMFDQPNISIFYHQLIEDAARQNTLALAWLKCDDAVIAYHLMFRYRNKIYSMVVATDAEWLKYSPGILIHALGVEWAIENGFTEFNHMQGDYAYKHQFSNNIRECLEYTFSRSLKGWFGEHLFLKRRALKRFLAKDPTIS